EHCPPTGSELVSGVGLQLLPWRSPADASGNRLRPNPHLPGLSCSVHGYNWWATVRSNWEPTPAHHLFLYWQLGLPRLYPLTHPPGATAMDSSSRPTTPSARLLTTPLISPASRTGFVPAVWICSVQSPSLIYPTSLLPMRSTRCPSRPDREKCCPVFFRT